jgi:hypothetical protein
MLTETGLPAAEAGAARPKSVAPASVAPRSDNAASDAVQLARRVLACSIVRFVVPFMCPP